MAPQRRHAEEMVRMRPSERKIELPREKATLSFGELERQFWDVDEKIAARLYSFFQNVRGLKFLGTLVSVSGDEAVWFILPVLLASVLTFPHGGPLGMTCKKVSCEMELLLDLFGAMATCATVEQLLKLFFQRPRPNCRNHKAKYFCIWGEWYSFPSGHTLRAFYLVSWILQGEHAKMVLGLSMDWEPLLLCWAVCVGVSRVAAGRHHPVDVIVGAMVGTGLGSVVETDLEDYDRAVVKIVCGVSVAIQVWFLLLGPLTRDTVLGLTGSKRVSTAAVVTVALGFFSFYASALYLVLVRFRESPDECFFGRFSHLFIQNRWQCKSW